MEDGIVSWYNTGCTDESATSGNVNFIIHFTVLSTV